MLRQQTLYEEMIALGESKVDNTLEVLLGGCLLYTSDAADE